ncbi:AAA family ATPase [Pseudonocardia hydrocarbonoxydans]|uniref:AAA family ATPase n=1 Tax=Pseudonocardia hydrocarbonoxydans TaxID=76726 RepID=UPI001C3F7120|nr:AAA family ATPase [Pseudonocardia hydrocarbonoxydans]
MVLYGPPASGKDTVTCELVALDARFRQFRRLKCGAGRTDGYRVVDAAQMQAVSDDLVWTNERYGAVYAVDRAGLIDALGEGVPVVHLGQPEAVAAVCNAVDDVQWLVVALWCDRDTARDRLRSRGSADVDERLDVWDQTPTLPPPACTINTGLVSPSAVAQLIADAVTARAASSSISRDCAEASPRP